MIHRKPPSVCISQHSMPEVLSAFHKAYQSPPPEACPDGTPAPKSCHLSSEEAWCRRVEPLRHSRPCGPIGCKSCPSISTSRFVSVGAIAARRYGGSCHLPRLPKPCPIPILSIAQDHPSHILTSPSLWNRELYCSMRTFSPASDR